MKIPKMYTRSTDGAYACNYKGKQHYLGKDPRALAQDKTDKKARKSSHKLQVSFCDPA